MMTERAPVSTARAAVPERIEPARRNAAARSSHPLLGAFPLSVISLATFLVIFAILMARLTAGADPALRPRASAALVAAGPGTGTVATRTSGAGGSGATATPVAASALGPSGTTPAIVSRASGVPGGPGGGDD